MSLKRTDERETAVNAHFYKRLSIMSEKKFHIPHLIEKKSEGGELSKEEIEYFIEAIGTGEVQQSQLGE